MKTQYIRSIDLLHDTISNWDIYPYHLPIIKSLNSIDFHENVTFFTGENGTGKSTLLEAIAVQYGFNPEGGSKNFNFSSKETHSELEKHIRITKGISRPKDGYFLRAESFYNVASNIDDLDKEMSFGPPLIESYGGTSLHEQSHGESFFSLFKNRFRGEGIYILDEPEAALSPQRQMSLLVRMNELIKEKSQFIIATHSPILLSYPHAKIIEFRDNDYHEVPYKETLHYRLYQSFLQQPEIMIKKLDIH